MRRFMTGFVNLPPSLRMGLFILSGGSLLAALYLFRVFRGPTGRIIFIGLALVALILFGYRRLLKKRKKRKAKPLEQGVAENAASTPQGVTEASRRAALEDLRKKFQKGVETFRSAGKNLYSLPWYLIVGEPGSGKTEAVRHSNIGFPPGLHDPLQGAGGTINMNWWFTNHAVVLDTAGRLMFDEVEYGATTEWSEFLKLLNTHRRDCPINGMLLVIPADSLIVDTADDIQRKGQKIAQQLDQIQRTLGIRFPVFAVVTKCDLINGFREFFDNIDDPQLQHQILGWSNPAPLDERFDPALVEQHLQSVFKQLERRRLGLLIDPVAAQDPSARRTDEVDSLYAFPTSLGRIVSRLRRYLELIFVTGEWSPKPLFLRGIYFTSSMREGEALDAELAEVLGVPATSLPEGRVWERERAYFLRDLFMEKVFREKGLVTRAAHVKRHYLRRKAMVLGAGFAGAALLLVWTLFGWLALNKSIRRPRHHFAMAAGVSPDSKGFWKPVLEKSGQGTTYTYDSLREIKVPGKGNMSPSGFHRETASLVKKGVRVPAIFKLAGVGTRRFYKDLREAQEKLYVSSVLRPLVDAARQKMVEETGPAAPGQSTPLWHEDAASTKALAQLIRLEANREDVRTKAIAEDGELLNLDDLFGYVLGPEDYNRKYGKDARDLEECMAWIYSGKGGAGQRPWPHVSLPDGASLSQNRAIDSGVNSFVGFWDRNKTIEDYDKLASELKGYKEAEKNFLLRGDSDTRRSLQVAKEGLDEAVTALGHKEAAIGAEEAQKIKESIDLTGRQAETAYGTLLRETESENGAPGIVGEVRGILDSAWLKMQAKLQRIGNEVSDAATANGLLALVGKRRLYEYRYDICMAASATHIAEGIERIAGDFRPCVYPEIPLTNMQGPKQFDGKYHAEAAVIYLSGWKEFDEKHKDQLAPEPAPQLLSRYGNDLKRHLNSYLSDYLSYWDYPAADSLAGAAWKQDFQMVEQETWPGFRDQMKVAFDLRPNESNTSRVNEGLKALYGILYKQLTVVKDEDVMFFAGQRDLSRLQSLGEDWKTASEEFENVLRRVSEGTATDYFRITAHNWGLAMPSAVPDCHKKLLATEPVDLQKYYFRAELFRPLDTRRLDMTFWRDIPLQGLRLIVQDAKPIQEVREALEELDRKYDRFPLVRLDRHGEGKPHLTPDEVKAARADVIPIVSTIGTEAPQVSGVYHREVNALLKKLWNVNLSDDEGAWVGKLQEVLDALPPAGTSWTCTARFYRLRERGIESPTSEEAPVCEFYKHYREIEFRQGEAPIDRALTTHPTRTYYHRLRLPLKYPDDDVSVNFFQHPDDRDPADQKTFRGQWACLEMLHAALVTYPIPSGVREADPGAASWVAVPLKVRVPFSDEDESLTFWVALEFRKGFPKIEEWPTGRPKPPSR